MGLVSAEQERECGFVLLGVRTGGFADGFRGAFHVEQVVPDLISQSQAVGKDLELLEGRRVRDPRTLGGRQNACAVVGR